MKIVYSIIVYTGMLDAFRRDGITEGEDLKKYLDFIIDQLILDFGNVEAVVIHGSVLLTFKEEKTRVSASLIFAEALLGRMEKLDIMLVPLVYGTDTPTEVTWLLGRRPKYLSKDMSVKLIAAEFHAWLKSVEYMVYGKKRVMLVPFLSRASAYTELGHRFVGNTIGYMAIVFPPFAKALYWLKLQIQQRRIR